jgi:hypothetical protein
VTFRHDRRYGTVGVRNGAQVFYVSGTGMELIVERPPSDCDEIAQVAFEQYAYCHSLDEVVGDPDEVARDQVPTDRGD